MQLMVLSGQNWPKNFFKEDIYCSIEGHHCILPEMFKWRNPPCFLQILFQAFGLLLGKGEFTLCYLLFCIIEQLISLIWNQNQFTELNSKLSLVCTWQRDRDYISLYEFLLGSILHSLFSSRLSHVKMILFSLLLRSFNRCQLPGFFFTFFGNLLKAFLSNGQWSCKKWAWPRSCARVPCTELDNL